MLKIFVLLAVLAIQIEAQSAYPWYCDVCVRMIERGEETKPADLPTWLQTQIHGYCDNAVWDQAHCASVFNSKTPQMGDCITNGIDGNKCCHENIHDLFTSSEASSRSQINELKEKIEFVDVTFQYPIRNEQVIKGVSLCVEAGQNVAFVGASGCGKIFDKGKVQQLSQETTTSDVIKTKLKGKKTFKQITALTMILCYIITHLQQITALTMILCYIITHLPSVYFFVK
ncbi:unnamed protein product, partial [Mesorhabditis belari]|uniref:Uncharacterized protein n=1 Tax=Mesorhabditis belari TaxID=2138241 RepID=A0AAF3E929_9BILA